MTLEGRVAEYLSQQKAWRFQKLNEYPVPQKKDDYHRCLYFFWGFQWHKLKSDFSLTG